MFSFWCSYVLRIVISIVIARSRSPEDHLTDKKVKKSSNFALSPQNALGSKAGFMCETCCDAKFLFIVFA